MKTLTQSRKKQNDNQVHAARGRLRGALNDSIQGQEVDDISEDYEEEDQPVATEPPPLRERRATRGRPRKISVGPVIQRVSKTSLTSAGKKRRMREKEINDASTSSKTQKILAESFVMKLFDRSLDLSKYKEQTALYPICRAWMANQPRNPNIRSYHEDRSPSPTVRIDNGRDVLAQLKLGKIRDVYQLPKPKKADISKIPPQKEPHKYKASEKFLDDHDPDVFSDMEELKSQHLTKWKTIKKDWHKHNKLYKKTNETNYLILQELFKP